MITINLLPKDRRRRGVSLPRPVLIAAGGAVVVGAGLVWFWIHLDGRIQSLQQEVATSRQELKRYEREIGLVDQLRADKKRLEERLQVVAKLTAEQEGPVRLLDQVSRLLPDEVWLTGLNKSKEKLVIQGFAFSNFGIANFMKELEKVQQPSVKNVELTFTEKSTVERVPVERFEITALLGS